jgi:hypothetical protein
MSNMNFSDLYEIWSNTIDHMMADELQEDTPSSLLSTVMELLASARSLPSGTGTGTGTGTGIDTSTSPGSGTGTGTEAEADNEDIDSDGYATPSSSSDIDSEYSPLLSTPEVLSTTGASLNAIFNSMLRSHRDLPTPTLAEDDDSPPPLERISRMTSHAYTVSVTHTSTDNDDGHDGDDGHATTTQTTTTNYDISPPLTQSPPSSPDNSVDVPSPPPPRRRESRRNRRQWNRFQYSYSSTGDGNTSNVIEENSTFLSTIPCEICSRNIPIAEYIQHVEQCTMRPPFEQRLPPHRYRRTFLPFIGDVATEFSYIEQIFGGRGGNLMQSLREASTSGNDYEFNLLLQELIGHVSKGVKNKEAVTEIVDPTTLPKEENCSICIEPLHQEADGKVVRKIKKCGHMFCQTCLFLWFDNSNKCPNCVAEVDTMSN